MSWDDARFRREQREEQAREADIRKQLPPDHIMREMAKLANEAAIDTVATQAEIMARDPLVAGLNGSDALLAFARAMRSTSKKVWPKKEARA